MAITNGQSFVNHGRQCGFIYAGKAPGSDLIWLRLLIPHGCLYKDLDCREEYKGDHLGGCCVAQAGHGGAVN